MSWIIKRKFTFYIERCVTDLGHVSDNLTPYFSEKQTSLNAAQRSQYYANRVGRSTSRDALIGEIVKWTSTYKAYKPFIILHESTKVENNKTLLYSFNGATLISVYVNRAE